MKTFIQLPDKIATLDPLIQEAMRWSPTEQYRLLRKLLSIVKGFKITDVLAFVISSIPLIHKLKDEEAVWKLVGRIEWAISRPT